MSVADIVVKEQAKVRAAQRDAATANTRNPKGTPVNPADSKEISPLRPRGRKGINLPFRDVQREGDKMEVEKTWK